MCRMASAMLVAPVRRWRLMTRLRRAAITAGPVPVRKREQSSSKVTSRTRWILFSIPQCSRAQVAMMLGGASSIGAELIR